MGKALMLDGSKFTWDKARGTGSSELSDLQLSAFPPNFFIKSHKTGDTRLFLRDEMIPMGAPEDNEVGGFRYISPGQGLTVTLWND